MDLLEDLTPAQREAVTHVDGPLLVLAGAGSGKTRVITRRVAHLISQGVPPHAILAITFTNKAAEEMRSRIAALVDTRGLTMATFHAFCARMLRVHGDLAGTDPAFVIYSNGDQKRAVKQAAEAAGLDPTHWTPERIGSRISRLKNRLQTADQFAREATDFTGKNVARIYTAYEALLASNNALDFDDLLMRTALALRDNAEFRDVLQDRYRYILIDEYQDTNEAQYLIASAIAAGHGNICATGDPDQSIYGWRGANINNILDFEKDFAGCKVVRLEQNYRSTPQILDAASSLIRFNTQRKTKDLHTENPNGPAVQVVEHESAADESRVIAEAIARDCPDGKGLGGVAVFYRVNALSRAVEDALRAAGIPYEIVRGTSFYERQEIRTLVAYLRVLVNPADDLAVVRVINTPARGIGDTTVKRLQDHAAARGTSLLEACRATDAVQGLAARATGAVRRFVKLVDELAAMDRSHVGPLVQRLIERTEFDAYCRKLSDGDDDRLLNVDEFVNIAATFDEEFPLEDTSEEAEAVGDGWPLMRFLERVSLASDQDDVHEDHERVHLMTLHAAKGLEFPVVYIIGVEQGLLPHVMAEEQGRDVEEERRLCFVGMTRAKRKLTLSHARYRMHRGVTMRQPSSVFLQEIGQRSVERHVLERDEADGDAGWPRVPRPAGPTGFRVPARRGARTPASAADAATEDTARQAALPHGDCPHRTGQLVRHRTYGVGTVLRVSGTGEGAKVTIRFPHLGEKTFVSSFARLEILKG